MRERVRRQADAAEETHIDQRDFKRRAVIDVAHHDREEHHEDAHEENPRHEHHNDDGAQALALPDDDEPFSDCGKLRGLRAAEIHRRCRRKSAGRVDGTKQQHALQNEQKRCADLCRLTADQESTDLPEKLSAHRQSHAALDIAFEAHHGNARQHRVSRRHHIGADDAEDDAECQHQGVG